MLNTLQGKEGLSEIAGLGLKKDGIFSSNEPISVLDTGWSPSPSTSTSTFSSSLAGGGGGSTDNSLQKNWSIFMVPESKPEEAPVQPLDSGILVGKWVPELNPFPAVPIACGGGTFGYDMEDWERVISESGGFRWIPGESDTNPSEIDQKVVALGFPGQSSTGGPTSASWSSSHRDGGIGTRPINNSASPLTNQVNLNQNLPPPLFYPQEHKEQLCLLQPPAKRQNLGVSVRHSQQPLKPPILEHQSFVGLPQTPKMVLKQEVVVPPPPPTERHHHFHHHQQQVVYDQLYKAAELIQAGNFSHAQGILARLNYHLSPLEKPYQRAAFYFKEALLQLPLLVPPAKNPTPVDGILKMGAYKLLSEASPLIQFMNLTSNQALLEAVGDAQSVHVIDFDVGFGAQWASFMQELPLISRSRAKSLKITAFASPSTHHPLELCLMHQTLTQFALDIGITLELEVVNFDTFDPNSYSVSSPNDEEAVVVNFPIWACSSRLSLLPSLLHLVKRLKPKITVSLERGCDRADLPFSQHLLHSLHHYEAVLDSITAAANVSSEAENKIERLLLQPRIESIVWGRFVGPASHIPHSRAVFASAGFSQVGFSSFSEAQAEYLMERSRVKGFRVEKRGGSLAVYWQRRELVLASAWRC